MSCTVSGLFSSVCLGRVRRVSSHNPSRHSPCTWQPLLFLECIRCCTLAYSQLFLHSFHSCAAGCFVVGGFDGSRMRRRSRPDSCSFLSHYCHYCRLRLPSYPSYASFVDLFRYVVLHTTAYGRSGVSLALRSCSVGTTRACFRSNGTALHDTCTSLTLVWLSSMFLFATHATLALVGSKNATDLEPSTWFHVSSSASGSVPTPTDGSEPFVCSRVLVRLVPRTSCDAFARVWDGTEVAALPRDAYAPRVCVSI